MKPTIIAHYFDNNERSEDSNLLSFGVSYNFVAQKWRILAIFPPKKSIFKLQNRYFYIIKLRLEVAELRVRQVKIGSKSCFADLLFEALI